MTSILAITHSTDVGGAFKSFQLSFHRLSGSTRIGKIHYVIPKRKGSRNNRSSQLNAEQINIPFSCSYLGSGKNKYKEMVVDFIYMLKYIILGHRKICKSAAAMDLVYLNSYVLWPMLLLRVKGKKYVIHIREIVDRKRFPIITYLALAIIKRADKIICIDKISYDRLGIKRAVIIRNPVAMDKVKILIKTRDEICKKYSLSVETKKIGIIGRIEELKNVDFLLKLSLRLPEYDFLVVGPLCGEYGNSCYRKYGNKTNVHFLGVIEEIEEIYAIMHATIRGESFLPFGRTVLEAIYSGCYSVLPVANEDSISEIQPMVTNRQIMLYKAGNLDDAEGVLRDVMEKDKILNNKYNNIDENCRSMEQLICAFEDENAL